MQLFYRALSYCMISMGVAILAMAVALAPAAVYAQTAGSCPGDATCDNGCTTRSISKCGSTQPVCSQTTAGCEECFCIVNGAGTKCTCN